MFNQPIIFVHGGPGLSSRAEAQVLGPMLQQAGMANCHFWNGPSVARGVKNIDLSYENSVRSLEDFIKLTVQESDLDKLVLVAHSFGTFYALAACHRLNITPPMLLCSPTLDMDTVEARILGIALSVQGENATSGNIRAYLNGPFGEFNEQRFQVILEALQTPGVLNRYFASSEKFAEYFSMAVGEYAFDLEEYFAVRSSMCAPQVKVFNAPVLALYGAQDPVVKASDREVQLQAHFSQLSQITFETSAHYPHFEEAHKFVQLLNDFVSGLSFPATGTNSDLPYFHLPIESSDSIISPS